MSGEQRRDRGENGGLPMVARVVDGNVNPAFGWHEGLEKRIVSHTLPWTNRMTFRLLKPAGSPCVVVSAGRVIVMVLPVPRAVWTGDMIDLVATMS